MSYREEQILTLSGVNISSKKTDELLALYNKLFKSGMHGLCFSSYTEGQEPGSQISEEQIKRRMEIIKPYTKWVRSFSSTDGNEMIPRIAHEHGLKALAGAWLGRDKI